MRMTRPQRLLGATVLGVFALFLLITGTWLLGDRLHAALAAERIPQPYDSLARVAVSSLPALLCIFAGIAFLAAAFISAGGKRRSLR